MLQATVSDCHLAQRCPRLLARLRGGKKNAWKVGLDGTGDLPGKLFHDRFAAPFHEDVSANPSQRNAFADCLGEPDESLSQRITLFLRDHYLIPYLEKSSGSLTDVQTVAIAASMARWAEVMAGFLGPLLQRDHNRRKLVARVFHPPERLLRAEHMYQDGEVLTVTGRYDALLLDPNENEAVVVDFKGRRPTDPCEDFAQIILYAWLIRSATGVTPRGLVLYLEEKGDLAKFSVDDVTSGIGKLRELFDIVRDVLEGKRDLPPAVDTGLCGTCFYRNECGKEGKATAGKKPAVQRTASPEQRASSPERRTPKASSTGSQSPDDEAEGQASLSRLCEMLGRIGLPVEPVGVVVGPRFLRLRVRPELEKGVTVNKLANRAVDLQVALDLKAPPLIQARQGHVSLDLPRTSREPLTLSTLLEDEGGRRPESTGAFPLGMTIDGRVYWADLAEPTMTSILIGGTSGSGKSVLLQSIVAGLGLCAPPGSVRFVLIDPKRVTFPHFADLPCVENPLYLDVEPALERLGELVAEMEDRYRLLEEGAFPDLRAYNEQAGEPLFRYVVIIDEYADMILDRKMRADLETCIQRIGQKGRAAGFHLVLATQRPDSKVVTGVIKANLQLKIALKVTSAANSRIILDEPGAEYLIGHGDMLVGGSTAMERLQGGLVTKTELEKLAQQ